MNGSHDDWSAPINMSERAEYLVFNSFGDLAFGRDLNVRDPDENKFKCVRKLMTTYVKFVHPVGKLSSTIS